MSKTKSSDFGFRESFDSKLLHRLGLDSDSSQAKYFFTYFFTYVFKSLKSAIPYLWFLIRKKKNILKFLFLYLIKNSFDCRLKNCKLIKSLKKLN